MLPTTSTFKAYSLTSHCTAYCYYHYTALLFSKGFGGEHHGDFSGDLMPGVGGGFPGSGGSLMGPDHPMFGGPTGMGYPQVSSVLLYCYSYYYLYCVCM
jgi:hypothetical protein